MRKLSHDSLPDTISAITKLALPSYVILYPSLFGFWYLCTICRSEQIDVRVYLNMKCAANILISSKVKKQDYPDEKMTAGLH